MTKNLNYLKALLINNKLNYLKALLITGKIKI